MMLSKLINSILLSLMGIAFLAQLIIDFSSDNIACILIVLTSSCLTILYIRWTNAINTHALSTYSIFGFCMTTQAGALLFQSMLWTSISKSLYQPMETFGSLALYQLVAIIAHIIFRSFTYKEIGFSPTLLRRLLSKMGLYSIPSTGSLWFMGWFGLISYLFTRGDEVGNKIFAGLNFLTWAPFLIPVFIFQIGNTYCDVKRNYFLLLAFTMLVAMLGLLLNARVIIFNGAMTIALLLLLAAMRSKNIPTFSQISKIGLVMIIFAVLSIPLSDLATAMVVARTSGDRLSAIKTVEKTFEALSDPQAIANYRQTEKMKVVTSVYNEGYITSPIAARLVETQFHDNAFYFANKLSPSSEDNLRKITVEFVWAILPQPFLDLLKIDVEKTKLTFSMGDYLVYERYGLKLGGFKTGSMFAQGEVLFGWFFPLIYLLICLLLFSLMELLTVRSAYAQSAIAIPAMLMIWRLFISGITGESLHQLISFILRNLLQVIIIYLIMLNFSRLFLWVINVIKPSINQNPTINNYIE
jgi:hypothetical protein